MVDIISQMLIDLITIATTGDATDFGDLTSSNNSSGMVHQIQFVEYLEAGISPTYRVIPLII